MRNKKIIIDIIILLLVIMFLNTALGKFMDFKLFTRELNNQPFPDSLTPILRWIIPVSELVIVLTLCFERTRTIGLYASLILMSMFTIYTILVLLHVFAKTPCGCGGVVKHLTWPQHLVFNLFFVTITFIAIKFRKNKEIQHFTLTN